MSKKAIRQQFRDKVFKRAGYKCQVCCCFGMDRQKDTNADLPSLDAHHITDRHSFTNGGYVLENGISLCEECHKKAEYFHATGEAVSGFSPEDLYKVINSSFAQAWDADGTT